MTFPIDSQTVQYDNITFTWDAVPNATLYTVQVSVFPTFPMFLVNQTVYNVNSITITNNIPKIAPLTARTGV